MKRKSGKIVCTIECRMTSSRLPGKVLMEAIDGKSMLEIMVERVKRSRLIDVVVLATTTNSTDDPIVKLAKKMNVKYFRGSENDVLCRVWKAVEEFQGQHVVELTGDCPLIDPEIVDQVIELYLTNECDYASTGTPIPRFPAGMDTQIFSRESLKEAFENGKTGQDREHVSWYITHKPDRFRIITLPPNPELQNTGISLTLDTKDDYDNIVQVLRSLYPKNKNFSCRSIIELFDRDGLLLRVRN